ncbi:hypothetical protein GUJ93_ZPchr0007g3770 [Zizania palustris]|uniref:Uncharacterized protein n=1 Tax=Zizania palustris TaxID=103762 RepID=A0A8J5TCW9_ZIZPA|nr:hypothetical protein GUJ93_ZPchr0007g3770 [Zizania palustris]
MAPVAGPGTVVGSAAALAAQEEMRWRQLDSGVSAVSFGFVATAILVSMFLAMAILEHFFRAPARGPGMVGMVAPPPPPPGGMLSRLRLILHGRVAGDGAGEAAFPGGSDLEAARKLDGRASPEVLLLKACLFIKGYGAERGIWETAAIRQGPIPVSSRSNV